MTNNTNQGNKSIGSVAGIDVSEIKGQRWEYVLAFSFFFGFLGVDRFITGRWVLGLLKLFTIGGIGIWYLVDLILIGTENFKDGDGNYILRYRDEAFAINRAQKENQVSVAQALEEFDDLRKKGIITEEEFQKKKADLLR
tara:strand:- start:168 stop:587 length:420 start_codon:yes stop_codon:yes gene_type:complete